MARKKAATDDNVEYRLCKPSTASCIKAQSESVIHVTGGRRSNCGDGYVDAKASS